MERPHLVCLLVQSTLHCARLNAMLRSIQGKQKGCLKSVLIDQEAVCCFIVPAVAASAPLPSVFQPCPAAALQASHVTSADRRSCVVKKTVAAAVSVMWIKFAQVQGRMAAAAKYHVQP